MTLVREDHRQARHRRRQDGHARSRPAVKPGDALFVRTDVRFSHEYVTPMAESLFKMGLGEDAKVTDPGSVFAFRDHLTFLDRVMPTRSTSKMGLKDHADASPSTVQESFTERRACASTARSSATARPSAEGICHNIVIEDLASPGSSSSAPTATPAWPARSAASRSASAPPTWPTAGSPKDVRVKVPESVRAST